MGMTWSTTGRESQASPQEGLRTGGIRNRAQWMWTARDSVPDRGGRAPTPSARVARGCRVGSLRRWVSLSRARLCGQWPARPCVWLRTWRVACVGGGALVVRDYLSMVGWSDRRGPFARSRGGEPAMSDSSWTGPGPPVPVRAPVPRACARNERKHLHVSESQGVSERAFILKIFILTPGRHTRRITHTLSEARSKHTHLHTQPEATRMQHVFTRNEGVCESTRLWRCRAVASASAPRTTLPRTHARIA